MAMSIGDHLEIDVSSPLYDESHRKYRMLIGLNWIVCLGRIDIELSTLSLSKSDRLSSFLKMLVRILPLIPPLSENAKYPFTSFPL